MSSGGHDWAREWRPDRSRWCNVAPTYPTSNGPPVHRALLAAAATQATRQALAPRLPSAPWLPRLAEPHPDHAEQHELPRDLPPLGTRQHLELPTYPSKPLVWPAHLHRHCCNRCRCWWSGPGRQRHTTTFELGRREHLSPVEQKTARRRGWASLNGPRELRSLCPQASAARTPRPSIPRTRYSAAPAESHPQSNDSRRVSSDLFGVLVAAAGSLSWKNSKQRLTRISVLTATSLGQRPFMQVCVHVRKRYYFNDWRRGDKQIKERWDSTASPTAKVRA